LGSQFLNDFGELGDSTRQDSPIFLKLSDDSQGSNKLLILSRVKKEEMPIGPKVRNKIGQDGTEERRATRFNDQCQFLRDARGMVEG